MSVLLAPITVTPSKPLTPSHLKGLLWTDVMYRATAHLAPTSLRYSPTTYHQTEQTLAFWEYLDHLRGDCDYSLLSEEEIGRLYVAFRAEGRRCPSEALRPYAQAAEGGWVHPASTRILECWTEHYARLGMHDPGLTVHQPPGFGLEQMIDRLCGLGLCVDQRFCGGPVYLDLTGEGLPLRRMVSADGRPNYLACALRDLMPLAPGFDEVVLLYDAELDPDYQLLQRVLSRLGPVVHRVPLGRVPIDGQIVSARHGDWAGLTADALLEKLGEQNPDPVLRLGMRLYFIAVLGPGSAESFRDDLLCRSLRRAERLLTHAGDPGGEAAELLTRQRFHGGHVDAYPLTSSLLAKHAAPPGRDLLEAVFL